MLSVDIASFQNQFYRDTKQFTKMFNAAVKGAAEYGFVQVTQKTPKRTGRARASWDIGNNRRKFKRLAKVPSSYRNYYADPPIPNITFDVMKHTSLWLSNDVEYIDYLEHGSHNYGPFAMLSTTVPNISRSLNVRLSRIL